MRISYWGSDVCSSDLKQRMKILVHDLGVEEFTRQVEEEFAHIATLGNDPPRAEFDRIAAYFTPPPIETGLSDEVDRSNPKSVGQGKSVSVRVVLSGWRIIKKQK